MGLNPISRISLLSEQLARLRGARTKNFAIKLLVLIAAVAVCKTSLGAF